MAATIDPAEEAVRVLDDIRYILTAMRVENRNAAAQSGIGSGTGPAASPPPPSQGLTLGTTKDAANAGVVVMSKVLSALGPITSFAQILGSAASGLQVFGAATQVLAATLAPVLLPVVLAAAGAILDLSEDIQGKLLPGLKEWNKLIFSTLVPVLGELVNFFMATVSALEKFFLLLLEAPANFRKLWSSITGTVSKEDKATNAATVLASRRAGATDAEIMKSAKGQGVSEKVIKEAIDTATNATSVKESREAGATDGMIRHHARKSGVSEDMIAKAFAAADAEKARAAAEAARRPAPASGWGVFAGDRGGGGAGGGRRGIDDVLASFRASIAPKAVTGSLGSVGSAATLAALNGDPIQKRMADLLLRIADTSDAGLALARDERRAAPVFGERRCS